MTLRYYQPGDKFLTEEIMLALEVLVERLDEVNDIAEILNFRSVFILDNENGNPLAMITQTDVKGEVDLVWISQDHLGVALTKKDMKEINEAFDWVIQNG